MPIRPTCHRSLHGDGPSSEFLLPCPLMVGGMFLVHGHAKGGTHLAPRDLCRTLLQSTEHTARFTRAPRILRPSNALQKLLAHDRPSGGSMQGMPPLLTPSTAPSAEEMSSADGRKALRRVRLASPNAQALQVHT